LLKELADRGLVVSYFALWNFLHHEGQANISMSREDREGPHRPIAHRRPSLSRHAARRSARARCSSSTTTRRSDDDTLPVNHQGQAVPGEAGNDKI
jgi:hypothetical protein